MTDGDHLVVRGPNWWVLGGAVALVVGLAVALGLAGSGGEELATETTATSTTAVLPATTIAPATTAAPATTIATALTRLDPAWPSEPGLSLRGTTAGLGGRIALAPWPDGGGAEAEEPLWIVDDGRSIGRFDLPTRPGDWPFPLLFGAGGVAVVAEGGVTFMPLDGAELTTLKPAEPVRYLVPAATPGELWIVHDDFGLTLVAADGSTMPVATPDGTGWVEAGVADGVMVRSATEEWAFPRYLAPGAAPVELTSVTDPQATLLGASGDLLAVFEPGPQIAVVDVRTDERIAEVPLTRTVTRACFSADRSQLAVGDFAGDSPISIVDLATGRRFDRFPDDQFGDMAWASEDELVVLDGARLVRFDADGDGEGIGLVTGPTWRSGTSATAWWIASERAPC
ncbi:MAG: hypothetical protein AAFZ07_03820 [Actinomycetota bacterium]